MPVAINNKPTRGLKAILLGDIPVDGGVPASFPQQLGFIEVGSANVSQADDEEEEFRVEELDQPLDIDSTEGGKTLTLRILNPNLEMFQLLFGGTITGTGETRTWNAPATRTRLVKGVQIVPRQGDKTTYPRVSLTPKEDYPLGRAGTAGIIVTGRILQPEKEGVSHTIKGNYVSA